MDVMAEQEWRKERVNPYLPKWEAWDILVGKGNGEYRIAVVYTEADADRILADHKAQQEVRELREELARGSTTDNDNSDNLLSDNGDSNSVSAGELKERLAAERGVANRLAGEIADLRAQLQAAEAERDTALMAEIDVRRQIGAFTTTTTLLQQAREALVDIRGRLTGPAFQDDMRLRHIAGIALAASAAIDAHKKAQPSGTLKVSDATND